MQYKVNASSFFNSFFLNTSFETKISMESSRQLSFVFKRSSQNRFETPYTLFCFNSWIRVPLALLTSTKPLLINTTLDSLASSSTR